MVLALTGAVLAARRPADAEPDLATYPDPRASALWAAASAVAFGIFLTALPAAASEDRAWALFDARVALVIGVVVWAGRELRDVRVDRAAVGTLAVPGMLLLLGTLLYTLAADHGELSLVSVLGSLFPVVTVGLGVTILKEHLSSIQVAGVVSALAGIVLIAL